MKLIKAFEDFIKLNEMGGWATTKTQGTKITPGVLRESVAVLEKIFSDFNKWLERRELAPLTLMGPAGSGSYYKQDLAENPEKLYGDVDVLVMYPLTKSTGRAEELKTLKLYNGLFLDWISESNRDDIDAEESQAISDSGLKLVINLESGQVQVDIIATFTYSAEWARGRYTPIRGIKGFVVGFLYQSLGTALGVSITDRGVIGKFRGGELVSPAMRKDVEERVITRDFDKFIAQLAEFADEYFSGQKRAIQLDSYLQSHPGIDVSNLSLEQICNGILALARTLEASGSFTEPKSTYKSSREFLDKVLEIYKAKIDKHKASSKYDKAQTELAFQQRSKVMTDADEAFGYVKQKLS